MTDVAYTSRYSWTFIAFVFLAIAFSVTHFLYALASSVDLPNVWGASEKWIESAECARTSGILLVGCVDGRIIPYADLSSADDIGHALLLGIFSMFTGRSLVLDHAGILNVVLNFAGLYVLVGLLFAARLALAAVLVLVGGSIVSGDFLSVTPHAVLPGVTCFAAVLPLALLLFAKDRPLKLAFWIVVGAGSLALAILLRQSIGMMGVVASAIALVAAQLIARLWSQRPALAIAAFALIVVSSMATTATLAIRDAIWNVPESVRIDRHGVQHNLFIGLGVVPNSFGIKWLDDYGLEAARRVDPSVEYVSRAYYNVLWSEYTRMVFSDPIEVVRIYTHKLWIFVTSELGGRLWLTIPMGMAGLLLYGAYLLQRRGSPFSNAPDLLVGVATIFILMHCAQAALIHPSMQYGAPVKLLYVLVLAASAEWLMRGRTEPAGPSSLRGAIPQKHSRARPTPATRLPRG